MLFATSNQSKINRFKKGLLKNDIELLSLKDLNINIDVNENGEESIYSWNKGNFYMVEKPSAKIDVGYPLNSISKYNNLDKYFTEITEEDKKLIEDNEDEVIEFITKSINNKTRR